MNAKTHTSVIALGRVSATAPVTRSNNVTLSHINGRPALTPIPEPVIVTGANLCPLAVFHADGGIDHTLFEVRGGDPALKVESRGIWTDIPIACSEIRCAMARGGGFLVMTDAGPRSVLLGDAGWTVTDLSVVAPHITVEAVPVGTVSATVGAVTLRNVDFSRSEPVIPESSVADLGNALFRAYSRIDEAALEGGLWFQPLIVRYHLLAADGRRLYTSSAMLMSADGMQCTDEIHFQCVKSGTSLEVPSARVSAMAYGLRVGIPADAVSSLEALGVVSVQVCVTPQLHSVSRSASVPWRMQRQGTDEPLLTVAMPGATRSFASKADRFRDILWQMMCRLPRLESCVLSLPLAAAGTVAEVERTGRSDTMAELEKCLMSLLDPVTYTPGGVEKSLLREISAPNSFTASCVCADGDMVLWGDVTPLPAPSVSVEELASGFADEPFRGFLMTTRTDGSRRMIPVSGPRMPAAWGRSVVFRDPQVCALDLFLEDTAGATRHSRLSLTPLPDGSGAGWISPDFSATAFDLWTGGYPEVTAPYGGERRQGAVVAARLSAPLKPLSATECCRSPVMAVLPAVRGQTSWSFSQCHIAVFSRGEVCAATVSVAGGIRASARVDSRGIDSPAAVAWTPDGIVALHRGQLFRIAGARSRTLIGDSEFVKVAWDTRSQQLFLLDAAGTLTVMDPKSLARSVCTAPSPVIGLTEVAGHLWFSSADGLRRQPPSPAPGAGLRHIVWRSGLSVPPHACFRRLEMFMSASVFRGRISLLLAGANSPDCAVPAVTITVSGEVRAPFVRNIVAPRRPFSEIEIEADVSADFQINSITVDSR